MTMMAVPPVDEFAHDANLCAGCGYDLRELDEHAVCPECGVTVAATRDADPLRLPNIDKRRQLVRGLRVCGCVGALWMTHAMITVAVALTTGRVASIEILLITQCVWPVLGLYGFVNLWASVKGLYKQHPLRRGLQRSLAVHMAGILWSMGMVALIGFLSVQQSSSGSPPAWSWMRGVLILGALGMIQAGVLRFMSWMRHIWQRTQGEKPGARRMRFEMRMGFAVLLLFTLCVVLFDVLQAWIGVPAYRLGPWVPVLFMGSYAGIVLLLAFWLTVSLELLVLAQHIHRRTYQ